MEVEERQKMAEETTATFSRPEPLVPLAKMQLSLFMTMCFSLHGARPSTIHMLLDAAKQYVDSLIESLVVVRYCDITMP